MKRNTKWFAGALALTGGLAMISSAQAQQVISDFSNTSLSATYANWDASGWTLLGGGAGIQAPVITGGTTPASFVVNAGGEGSGHVNLATPVLLNPGTTGLTLSLTLNSPAASDIWAGIKFVVNDDTGATWYGAYTGLWGVDNTSWASTVGTAVWAGNTLTMTVPLTSTSLAAAQGGADHIYGFDLVFDPAYYADSQNTYTVNYNSLITTVPEPTTLALAGLGAAGLLAIRRRK